MAIPFAGKITTEIAAPILEELGLSKEDARTVAKVVGFGVTIATFDVASAVDHLGTVAEFAAQGDWHP